jgi:hypothetical protein
MCESGGCGDLTECGEECVDTDKDPDHCGDCDQPCLDGQSCSQGKCKCSGQQQVCDNACVDTKIDPDHCGGCNDACKNNEICVNGNCQ